MKEFEEIYEMTTVSTTGEIYSLSETIGDKLRKIRRKIERTGMANLSIDDINKLRRE